MLSQGRPNLLFIHQSKRPMKSYHMNLGAGIDGLTLKEHDSPAILPSEVLVRVHAVSLNFRELMILVDGKYPLPVKPDVIAVSDGAGEIVAVGSNVTRAKVGDRVTASIFPRWIDGLFSLEFADQLGGSLDGMLTECAALSEDAIIPIPEHLCYLEAATLPCAAVTAWNALTGGKRLQPGEVVLTLGSGGVSLFAVQFAKLFGARVIATTSNDTKAARLSSLGADDVINYQAVPDWAGEVRRLTMGLGVDRVVEVGGGPTMSQSFAALSIGGEVALVGNVGGGSLTTDLSTLAPAATVRRVAVGSRAQFLNMARAISVNRMRPVIDRVFSFEEAAFAFAYYAEQKNFGKVVIRVSS
jgi:NADPH:quinone reductase-like Zn-dependent oxidoreductase